MPEPAERRPRDRFDDNDDDWVGEPPEGHHTRDQAKPEFWRMQRPPEVIAFAFVVVVVVLVIVLVLR